MFKQANIGTADRIVRLVLGIALVATVFVGPQTLWGWLTGIKTCATPTGAAR